jgi:hypothetical protein
MRGVNPSAAGGDRQDSHGHVRASRKKDQERIMKRIFAAALLTAAVLANSLLASPAHSQQLRAVSMLSGNETIVLRPHFLKADCTAGQLPDVRIVDAPQNGSVRFDKATITINAPSGTPRAKCNGKEIEAIGVVYKSHDGYVGVDRIVMKADFHNGNVSEMIVLVDVR